MSENVQTVCLLSIAVSAAAAAAVASVLWGDTNEAGTVYLLPAVPLPLHVYILSTFCHSLLSAQSHVWLHMAHHLACLYKLHRWNIFTIFALCACVCVCLCVYVWMCLFGDFFPVRWTSFAFLPVFHYFAFYVFAEHSMRDEKRNRINFRTHAYTKFMFMKLNQNNAREIKQSDNFDADMRINIK